MQFDRERVGDVNIIRVRDKKLTSHEAPEMKTALLGLTLEDDERFLLNLDEVENMDSTGLGSFLFGIRQAENRGKDMRFCKLRDKIRFLIRIAHLEQVIQVYETEEEALEDFQRDDEDE